MSAGLEALRVSISPTALAGIEKRARARLTRFEAAGRAGAFVGEGELLRRNIRGVAGEQAVLRWLRVVLGDAVLIRDAADAADGPSDLEVTTSTGVLGIEVKTTTYDGWLRHGRSITENQLFDTDAEVYVWCAGPDELKPREVYVIGWSTTADVRREASEQRYTGHRDGSMRPAPVSDAKHLNERVPEYGVDDSGFDEHEWYQSVGLREVDDANTDESPDVREPVTHLDALSTLLRTPEWCEGNEPRPGFGPSKAIVRANAAVRQLAALVAWIGAWEPDD